MVRSNRNVMSTCVMFEIMKWIQNTLGFFFQGYVTRQALYACATCDPENLAGVCLACSLECHEGHELFELYTKRFYFTVIFIQHKLPACCLSHPQGRSLPSNCGQKSAPSPMAKSDVFSQLNVEKFPNALTFWDCLETSFPKQSKLRLHKKTEHWFF